MCYLIQYRIFPAVAGQANLSNHVRFPSTSAFLSCFPDETSLERAKFLESKDHFVNIHAATAASGQTTVPKRMATHPRFTCFVQAPEASARDAEITTGERRLIRPDGGRAGPAHRGKPTRPDRPVKVRTLCCPWLSSIWGLLVEYVGYTQDVAQYLTEQIIPDLKAPSLEICTIALAGGFSEGGRRSMVNVVLSQHSHPFLSEQ